MTAFNRCYATKT